MIDNTFRYFGDKPAVSPSFSVEWPMSVCYFQMGNVYIVDFTLNIKTNTTFSQQSAKDFFNFGISLNRIKNVILDGKTPKSIFGMGSYYDSKGIRLSTPTGGGFNGYGLYFWLEPTNGIVKISRYYTVSGGNGQWAITGFEPGAAITGRMYMIV